MTDFLKTLLISVAAAVLFDAAGIFLPYMLGPMSALLVLRQFTRMTFRWPTALRTAGLILIGIQIGSSFTRDAVLLMWTDLPMMAFMTVSIVGFAILLGLLFRKLTGETLQTSLLGSLPGGLSQMVILAEEVKSASTTTVVLMQTIRVLLVVFAVPFLTIFMGGRGETAGIVQGGFVFEPAPFLIALLTGTLLYFGMERIRFPLPQFMSPIVTMAAVQSVTGSVLIELPEPLLLTAQLLVGAHLGLQMEQVREKLTLRMGVAILLTNVLLLGFSIGIAFILSKWLAGAYFLDYFLSAAPGGMAEMIITAIAAGGDVPLITSFHLFRVFFILLLAAPAVAYAVKRLDAKSRGPV